MVNNTKEGIDDVPMVEYDNYIHMRGLLVDVSPVYGEGVAEGLGLALHVT